MIEKENQMLTEAYMYKILIVEDDSTITAVLKRTLEKWGYEAETISDFGRWGKNSSAVLRIWCCSISHCLFLMAITGVRNSGRQARFRLFLFPRLRMI